MLFNQVTAKGFKKNIPVHRQNIRLKLQNIRNGGTRYTHTVTKLTVFRFFQKEEIATRFQRLEGRRFRYSPY